MTRIILLLFCFISLSVKSQTINWLSFEEAVELNKKDPKKIIIDVYTNWCGWCKVMDKNTFSNKVIADYINTHYYAVKLNAETKDTIMFEGKSFVFENKSHQLAQYLLNGKMGYPSIVFLNEKVQLLTVVQSYLKPEEIEPILEFFATDKYLSMTYEPFKQSFKSKLTPSQEPEKK